MQFNLFVDGNCGATMMTMSEGGRISVAQDESHTCSVEAINPTDGLCRTYAPQNVVRVTLNSNFIVFLHRKS